MNENEEQVRIAIKPNGFVTIGIVSDDHRPGWLRMTSSHHIRNWATRSKKGIGTLVAGPTPDSTLDWVGDTETLEILITEIIRCDSKAWIEYLRRPNPLA